MSCILSLSQAKPKCPPKRFGLGTIGIEGDLAIEWPCMFKDVKRDLPANPTPTEGRSNVEPPHTQPAAIDEVLRDAAYTRNFTMDSG